jgi:small-conductance mechanosensitive channel
VIVKLEFQVTYDTDVDLVRKLIKRIGQEMLEDPECGPNLIETLNPRESINWPTTASWYAPSSPPSRASSSR